MIGRRTTARAAAPSARADRAWSHELLPFCVLLLSGLLLVGCAGTGGGPSASADGSPPAHGARGYKVGRPYQIKGVWYYPKVDYDYAEIGVASWYGPGFDGQATANGEIYDMNDLTAAHRTLPLPSVVRVTNLENGRSIKLRVNDRGPFVGGRIIDVSRRAAQLLGFHGAGTARVQVDLVEDESRQLAAALGVPGETLAWRAPAAQAAPVVAPVMATAAYEPAPTQIATAEIGEAAIVDGSPYQTYQPAGEALAEPAAVAYSDQPGDADSTTVHDPSVFAETLDDPAPAHAVGGVPVAQPPRKATSSAGNVYVQAAAFAEVDRADRARRRLAPIGPTVMSPGRVNGRELLRVRVGPLGAEDDVDRVLASVSRAGFPDCRLVVE